MFRFELGEAHAREIAEVFFTKRHILNDRLAGEFSDGFRCLQSPRQIARIQRIDGFCRDAFGRSPRFCATAFRQGRRAVTGEHSVAISFGLAVPDDDQFERHLLRIQNNCCVEFFGSVEPAAVRESRAHFERKVLSRLATLGSTTWRFLEHFRVMRKFSQPFKRLPIAYLRDA